MNYKIIKDSLKYNDFENDKSLKKQISDELLKNPCKDEEIKPECKYFGKCGGCNLMNLKPEIQIKRKEAALVKIFSEYKIDVSKKIQTVSGPFFNYRCRFQLNDGGFSVKKSNEIIQVDECVCAEKPFNEYLKNTKFEERPEGRIHFFASEKCKSENKIKIAQENPFSDKNEENQKNFGGKKSQKIKIKKNNYFSGTVFLQDNCESVEILNKEIFFDVRGFFQSNLYMFEKTIELICQNLCGKNALDLYAGCGSISVFLADIFENVILVEHNRDALVFAEKNLSGKKHTSFGLSGQTWVNTCAKNCPDFDAIIVDPPRSGMEKEVRQFIADSKTPFVKSLSCDPFTHARDLSYLCKNGYEIKKIFALDFYPQTTHIESLAFLQKIQD